MTDTKKADETKISGRRSGQVRASKRSIEYCKIPYRVRRSQRSENWRHDKNASTHRSVQEACRSEDRSAPGVKTSGVNQSEHKRPRSGVEIPSHEYAPESKECRGDQGLIPPNPLEHHSRFICQPSLIDEKQLDNLLSLEMDYHPNNAFLYYVNSEQEDKVDAAQRNEAVHNLRFMHNAFFNLPTAAFCKAVNLIDRFIVKVKVKPKYMACVATASYRVASKLCHLNSKDFELPAPEALVQLTRCGGNAADLSRMEDILSSKLSGNLDGVNAFDFLSLFINYLSEANKEQEESDGENNPDETRTNAECVDVGADAGLLTKRRKASMGLNQLSKRLATRMEIALCHLDVYRHRPACLALGIMAQCGVGGLGPVADMCRVNWIDVYNCAELIDRLYKLYYRAPVPRNRRQMVWTLSRRTLFRIGYSSPTPLDTISEVYEPADEDEWRLPLLFEP